MYWGAEPNTKGVKQGITDFANYLEKEKELAEKIVERDREVIFKYTDYLDKENEISGIENDSFFTNDNDNVDKHEVAFSIDNNRKGLKNNEAKFYAMSFDPSEEELKFLEKAADKEALNLEKAGIGTREENKEKIMRDMLKGYSEKCMDEYAKNFNREGINSSKDLVWFGKVEKNRYWKWNDKEVAHNRKIFSKIRKLEKGGKFDDIDKLKSDLILESTARKGGRDVPIYSQMPKSGNNYHVHIVVSRKDKTQTKSLSPEATARQNHQHKINGRVCSIGFNRDNFAKEIENVFDNKFEYYRPFYQSYEGHKAYAKYNKGSNYFYQMKGQYLEEREELHEKIRATNKEQWMAENKEKWMEEKAASREKWRLENGRSNSLDINGVKIDLQGKVLSQAKQSAFRLIGEESQGHKTFIGYGENVVKILRGKNDILMKQQMVKLASKMCMDFCSAASLGAISVAPLQIALGAGKGLKDLFIGKDKGGIEK